MKKWFVLPAFALALSAQTAQPGAAAAPKKPRLILAVVVDQFRYDYLTRFRSEYKGGLDRMLRRGAVFTNARYEHFPTVTAIGHSTFMSGATPSISGIIGNDWWERETNRNVTSVIDFDSKLLGGEGVGSSPRRMLVSTVGDELKTVSPKSKVISVSLKDRSAVLPGGHMADGAYWFDNKTGQFVSSTFYFDEMPGWAKDFNAARPADKYLGVTWMGKTFSKAANEAYYASLAPSPWGNELVAQFTERAMQAEQLGRRGVTDIMALSFSCNDYIGHAKGPDAPEVHDISLRTDALLDRLLRLADAQVGPGNTLVVLTADHGVAPLPEKQNERKMPGGRMPAGSVTDAVQKALTAKYGEGKWIVSPSEHSLYLNAELIASKNLDRAEVNRAAAMAALTVPHVFRVYTREQLREGSALEDQVGKRVMNGFYVRRGADVYVLLEPYWIFSAAGTTHGTTFSYDAHVPVIFMGPGIKPGRYHQQIAVNDIAPTLATLLDLETPSGSTGRALHEILTY